MTHYATYMCLGLMVWLQPSAGVNDYSNWIAPAIAAVATIITVLGQIKQKRLEVAMSTAAVKQEATERAMTAWELLFKERSGELRDIRRRLLVSERHTRICEKGQLKLVAQLIRAGVDIDVEKILDDLSKVDGEFLQESIHESSPSPTPNTTGE